jgi:uncharacterized protein YdbL (DUF1318 family)
MTCAGCNQLADASKTVTLITGEQVCNTCPSWRAECEYRAIVAMPDDKRIAHYKDIAKKRGEAKAREVVKQVNQYRRMELAK